MLVLRRSVASLLPFTFASPSSTCALKRCQHRPVTNIRSPGRFQLKFVAVRFDGGVPVTALVHFGSKKHRYKRQPLKGSAEVPHYCRLEEHGPDCRKMTNKKSTQVVRVRRCVLGCGLTSMKGHDLITLQL